MKVNIHIECPYCGERFETARGIDMHRPGNVCATSEKLRELGWTQKRDSGVWRRPKGRRE